MDRLKLLQETIDIIDLNIIVCQGLQMGEENEFFSRHNYGNGNDFINIPLDLERFTKDIDTSIWAYTVIDLGFDFTEICSYKTFVFFHELGHLVNGMIENELIYVTRISNLPKNKIERAKEYIKIPDEWWAWVWAYDFIKSNKEYIKKLDSQLW